MTRRAELASARRIVVKVGSRSVVGASLHELGHAEDARFEPLAAQLVGLREGGRSVVLVSSGAVALGRGRLGFSERPRSIAQLQACAAVGQSLLMRGWETAFGSRGVAAAQMLLSHADLEDRERYLNARGALAALLELGAVPVINENDTVAVDEIRFGDNDQLAAMVCTLADADLLVLLSDVEGLLDEGQRVPVVEDVDAARAMVAPRKGDDVGSGGMGSKLEAARRASRRGVPVVIADARDATVLARVLAGEDVGTLVVPSAAKLPSRKHWIAYTLRPRGDLILDEGAARAIREGGRSLLPAGVVGVRGAFSPGDAVVLRTLDGVEIGRGLTRYGTADAATLAGAKTDEIRARLGFHGGDELVHRDDLVLV
ncbi:MAG: glutamate 5-kinase [Sandaracinaceae bacterium]|nr:glutamate 5-kinase [Sandaracinaceae bacterium]